jgi:hypothetical protein
MARGSHGTKEHGLTGLPSRTSIRSTLTRPPPVGGGDRPKVAVDEEEHDGKRQLHRPGRQPHRRPRAAGSLQTAPRSPTSAWPSTNASSRTTGPGGTGRRRSSRSTSGATRPRTSPNRSARATARSFSAAYGRGRGRPPRGTSGPRPRSTPTRSPRRCGGQPPGPSGPSAAATATAAPSVASSTTPRRLIEWRVGALGLQP